MGQPAWSTMTDEAKAEAAKKAATSAKAEARRGIFSKGPAPANDLWSAFPAAKAKPDPWEKFGKPENPDIVGQLEQAIPGVGIQSGYRTPEYQADMRRRGYNPAQNSAHLDGSALDLTPPAGKSMGWLRDRVGRLHPNARFLNEGDHLHVTFPGWYASVRLYEDQTVSEAVASWEADNGPVGERQVVLWRWLGKKEQWQCA